MTILIQITETNRYLEERLVEEINDTLRLLGITEAGEAKIKVIDNIDTLIENAKNAIQFFTGLELDYHFANEWDNQQEIEAFETNYRRGLDALNAIVNTDKID